jgi:hypothetical protein
MDTTSNNQNPMSQTPTASEQQHRSLNLLMIVVAITIIIGFLYWWSATERSDNSVATGSQLSPAEQAARTALIESQVASPAQLPPSEQAARTALIKSQTN